MKRLCRACEERKATPEFYKTHSYTRHICKKCENKALYKWRMRRAKEMKHKAIEYLGNRCKRCGYDKCIYALEFNHLRNKKYEPTRMFRKGLSWSIVREELDKCELLCANCHREVTFQK